MGVLNIGKKYFGIDIKDCVFLGEGHEGRVYLTPDGYVLKIFRSTKKSMDEYEILKKVEGSNHFPRVIAYRGKCILREYVEGIPLKEYISAKGLSKCLAKNIIELVEDFNNLNFKRLDIRSRHIFVRLDESIQVIDPRKTYTMNVPIPYEIIKTLKETNVLYAFINVLEELNPPLMEMWKRGIKNHEN